MTASIILPRLGRPRSRHDQQRLASTASGYDNLFLSRIRAASWIMPACLCLTQLLDCPKDEQIWYCWSSSCVPEVGIVFSNIQPNGISLVCFEFDGQNAGAFVCGIYRFPCGLWIFTFTSRTPRATSTHLFAECHGDF